MPMPTPCFDTNASQRLAYCLTLAVLGLVSITWGDPTAVTGGQTALLGTLAAIGGGLAAGGIAGGFLSRPDERSPESFVPEENEELFEQAERLRDPSFGFGQFRRLANEAAGTADQTLQATAATGGSERLARTRQQAQVQQAANDIMDRFGQFRLQAQQQAASVQQQGIGNLLQGQRMAQKQNLARDRATMSLFNNIASLGGQVGATAAGQLGAQQLFDGGGQSFRQFRRNQNSLGALRAGRQAGVLPQRQSFSDIFR